MENLERILTNNGLSSNYNQYGYIKNSNPFIKELCSIINKNIDKYRREDYSIISLLFSIEKLAIKFAIRDNSLYIYVFVGTLLVNDGIIEKILNEAVEETKLYMEAKGFIEKNKK